MSFSFLQGIIISFGLRKQFKADGLTCREKEARASLLAGSFYACARMVLWLAKVLAACGHAARNGLFRLPGNSAQTAVLRLTQGERVILLPGG